MNSIFIQEPLDTTERLILSAQVKFHLWELTLDQDTQNEFWQSLFEEFTDSGTYHSPGQIFKTVNTKDLRYGQIN